MTKKSLKEICIDLMVYAETHEDIELQDGFIWLGKQAIKDNVSIYDKLSEVLIKHHNISQQSNGERDR